MENEKCFNKCLLTFHAFLEHSCDSISNNTIAYVIEQTEIAINYFCLKTSANHLKNCTYLNTTECDTDLDQCSKLIIFESILTTFEASAII